LIEATNENNAPPFMLSLVEAFFDSRVTGTHHSPAEEFFETIKIQLTQGAGSQKWPKKLLSQHSV
jgi:hypothetical protein